MVDKPQKVSQVSLLESTCQGRTRFYSEFANSASGLPENRQTIGYDLPHFGNTLEIMRRIFSLPAIDEELRYEHLDQWAWCDRILTNYGILWQGYLKGSLSELASDAGWTPQLTDSFCDNSGALIAHYLILMSSDVQSNSWLRMPPPIAIPLGHICENLQRFAADYDLTSQSIVAWRIVVDLLHLAMWQSDFGQLVRRTSQQVVELASRRFTAAWIDNVASPLMNAESGGDDAKLQSILSNSSSRPNLLFDEFLASYRLSQSPSSLSEMEHDYLGRLAIFEAAIEFVAERSEFTEVENLQRIIEAEQRSCADEPWIVAVFAQILGLHIYPEMRAVGRNFIEEATGQLGRGVIPQIFGSSVPAPSWVEIENPSRWIGRFSGNMRGA